MTAPANESLPILEELEPASDKLYFIFGGIAANIGMPPFEFYNSSRIVDDSKIFFRDFSQSWYQNGLPGIGKDVFAIHQFIQQKIHELTPAKLFFVGNSMGGFAAILFACLSGRGTAIAFAPQTFISPQKRLKYYDTRWWPQLTKTYLSSGFKKHVWDLEALLEKRNPDITINIYTAKDEALDYLHAHQLQRFDYVNIYEFDVGGHTLVKHFRDSGLLTDIIQGKTTTS